MDDSDILEILKVMLIVILGYVIFLAWKEATATKCVCDCISQASKAII